MRTFFRDRQLLLAATLLTCSACGVEAKSVHSAKDPAAPDIAAVASPDAETPPPAPVNIIPEDPNTPVGTVLGTPIVATPGQWSWVPFAASACADGSATGIGISPVAGSTRLVIFMEGGGRCDSAATCGPHGSAANLGGFGAANLTAFAAKATGIFNRGDATNPVAKDSFVYVPYCTGDDHSGDNVASYGTHHHGFANMGLFLQRIVPTFAGVKEVLLTGSSAGGSGAFWNYYRTQKAFGDTPVVLLDDAGPFLGAPTVEISAAAVQEWGLAKTVPPGCDACLPGPAPAGVQNFYPFFVRALPGHRGALLTSNEDAHVSARDNLSGPAFATALTNLADSLLTVDPGFKVFYVPSSQHTWLGGVNGSLSKVTVNGTSLSTFITRALNDDPAWADVR